MYDIQYYTGTAWVTLPNVNLEGVTIVKAKEDDRIFARVSVDGSFKFYGASFDILYALLSDFKVESRVRRNISQFANVIATGYLNLLGKWDIDNSTCELSFDVVDQYTPVFKLWDEKIGFKSLFTYSVMLSVDSETKEITFLRSEYHEEPEAKNNWVFYSLTSTHWIFRKQVIGFYADGWDDDWALPDLSDPWLKYHGKYSKAETTTQTLTTDYSHFYYLTDIINLLATNSGCDFDETDYSNYLTSETDFDNILIAHKKNVISPGEYVKDRSLSLSSFLKTMKALFNLDWYLDAGDLKFKHPSELNFDLPNLTTYPAHDLTTFEGINWGDQKKVFSYSVDIPFKEIWNVESSNQVDFNGLPIRYEIESDQMVEFDLSNFQANFTELMNAQSENYTGDVSDDGFCIVACDASRVIVNRTGILSGDTLINGKLALSQLHYDHFKTGGRYFTSGEMNGSNATFTNVKRTREIIEISAPATVDDFIFSNLVKLSIGYCELISVTEYLNGDYAKIKLMY